MVALGTVGSLLFSPLQRSSHCDAYIMGVVKSNGKVSVPKREKTRMTDVSWLTWE